MCGFIQQENFLPEALRNATHRAASVAALELCTKLGVIFARGPQILQCRGVICQKFHRALRFKLLF